ncbi:MAG TPA: pyridoxal phosphate-dependent aminotransferase [Polyangiaceae bacterium]|nr:pyridoxal phosphate-dependent aminotransferase [Polyangiaceae bacterium]
MPNRLAQRLDVVAPSATLAMSARAAELRAKGVHVFPFGVGEPDFEPPDYVREAAKAAIDQGASKYTAVTGIPALKQAICKATERSRGFLPTPAQVTVSVGAKHALFNLALALYEPGDEVVIPKPYWVTYPEQVRILGATPVIVDTREEEGWKMPPERLEKALTTRTKAVVLCTPSNPTGAAYTEAETRALLEVLRKHDCWLVVDEIYAELVYDGFKFVSAAKIAPDMLDRIVIIDGVSKTFAMTGWRIGWSLAPPALTKAMDVVQGQSSTHAAMVAQHAAVAALRGDLSDFPKTRELFQKRRDTMVAGLESIPGFRCRKPEGAFYCFADVRGLYGLETEKKTLQTDEDVAFWLLDSAHVAAVPGSGFGMAGYMRFSYAASEERIKAGIEAIRNVVDRAWRADRTGRTKLK